MTSTDWRGGLRRSAGKVRQASWRQMGTPYRAFVTAVQSDTDNLAVSSYVGDTTILTSHPYVGAKSWIRAVPEVGCTVMLSTREDTKTPAHMGYVSDLAPSRAKEYEGRSSLWRRMNQGEMDICSIGAASAYFGRRGNAEFHGGVTNGGLFQDMLESRWFAPLHRRTLHEKMPSIPLSLGADEERLGVVKRPHPLFPLTLETLIPTVNALGPTFAKEWLVGLFNLIYHREGDVTDDFGIPEVSLNTGQPLRAMHQWKTSTITTNTSFEVDILGNVGLTLAAEAVMGYAINIPTGEFNVLTGLAMSFMCGTTFDISAATSVTIESPATKFGAAAVDALVLGTKFMAALQTYLAPVAAALTALAAETTLTASKSATTAGATAVTTLLSQLNTYLSTIVWTI